MLEGKATIVLSYSVRFQRQVAEPVSERLEQHGFRTVLVGEEPLPPHIRSDPNAKVEWFFRHADMAVFLATADDRLESGEVHTRPNIIDEHRLGQQLPHLSHRLLVFKADDVVLPSNINPVYERLPLDDPDWIVGKIVEQARSWGVLPQIASDRREPAPESSLEPAVTVAPAPGDDLGATDQATTVMRHAVDALQGAGPKRTELRRAELALAGLRSDAGSSDTLGVHLANGLFALRHDIRLRRAERVVLLRTYLKHSRDDNVPGVFWIRDFSKRRMVELLTSLVQSDSDDEVRARALEFLGTIRAPATAEDARKLVEPLLVADDQALRAAALDFVANWHRGSLRDTLEDPRLLERDRHRVSQTVALLDLPGQPSLVMDRFIDDAYVRSKEVESGLLQSARRVRAGAVFRALDSAVPAVRRLGVQMAAEKGLMTEDLGRELIERDRTPAVRLDVVRSLLAVGERVDLTLLDRATSRRDDDLTGSFAFDEEQQLALEVCMRLPIGVLRAEIEWLSSNGPACYEALGIRDQAWRASHVRRDLGNSFASLRSALEADWRAKALAGLEARAGRPPTKEERAMAIEQVSKQLKEFVTDKLGAFLTRRFQRAALRVLVKCGRPTDVRFARLYATSDDQDLLVEALRLFDRFGTAHDVRAVLRLSEQIYRDEYRRLAARTAFRLAYKKDKLDVLQQLQENHTVRTWAVSELGGVAGGLDEAWRLLWSDDAAIRAAAADVIWEAVRADRADGLLSLYARGQHFYNVVRRIDRRLYGPAWLPVQAA